MTEAHVQRRLGPYTKLIDTVAGHVYDSALWMPTWRSEASIDIDATSATPRTNSTSPMWGRDPCATVQTALAVLVRSVIEHTTGVALLLQSGGVFTIAVDALTRASLEAAAQTWWLAEPGIGGRSRVARLYALRRESAGRYKQTATQMGLTPTAGYSQTVADVEGLYVGELGLTPSRAARAASPGARGSR